MKYATIVLLIASAFRLAGQGDCHFEVDKFDEFTKERTTHSEQERIAVQVDGNVHFQACYENKDYFFRVKMALNEPWLMPEENQIWLMLGDDNILKLRTKEEANGMDPVGKTSSHEATFDVAVTEDQWEILKSNKATRMRFILKEDHYDFTIKDEKAAELQHLMTCVEKE